MNFNLFLALCALLPLLLLLSSPAQALLPPSALSLSASPAQQALLLNGTFSLDFTVAFSGQGIGYQPFVEVVLVPTVTGLSSFAYALTPAPASPTRLSFSSLACRQHPIVRVNQSICPFNSSSELFFFALPYASLDSTSQPETLTLTGTVPVSAAAFLLQPVKIYYRAGFLLNDDPNGGAPAVFTQASANVADWASVIVTPQPYVARVSAPGRFVSGPSFTQTTTVALDLAAGQRFENVTLELILSDRIAYVSSTISGSPQNSTFPVANGLAKAPVNNTLSFFWPSVLGAGVNTLSLNVNAFVPLLDAQGALIVTDPTACVSTNGLTARLNLTAVALNGVNTSFVLPNVVRTPQTCYTDSSLGFGLTTDSNFPGLTVTDHARYTLSFSVSDYFTVASPFINATILDGQRFDSEQVAQITYGASSQSFNSSTFTVAPVDAAGQTLIDFNAAAHFPSLAGPGTGSLRFGVATLETFPLRFGSPRNIYHGDRLTTNSALYAISSGESSLLRAGVVSSQPTFVMGSPVLSIYALNGAVCAPSCPSTFAVGDLITYRLLYGLPTTDFSALSFTLYRPIPLMTASPLSFTEGVSPATDLITTGPSTSLYSGALQLSTNGAKVTVDYGTNDNNVDLLSRQVDLLWSQTLGDYPEFEAKPWTVVALSSENGIGKSSASIFSMRLPTLVPRIAPVSTIGTAALSQACSECTRFCAPGTASCAFTTPNLTAIPDSTLLSVQGGNKARFLAVLSNTGNSDALNVAFTLNLPSGWAVPSAGLNAELRFLDGTLLTLGTDYSGDLFSGIALATPVTGSTGASGRRDLLVQFDLEAASTFSFADPAANLTIRVGNWASIPLGRNHVTLRFGGNVSASTWLNPIGPTASISTSTSLPETTSVRFNASSLDLAVGEVVTVNVTIRLPEGAAPVAVNLTIPSTFLATAWSVLPGSSLSSSTSFGLPALPSLGTTLISLPMGTVSNLPDGVSNAQDDLIISLSFRLASGTAGNALSLAANVLAGSPLASFASASTSFDVVAPAPTVAFTVAATNPQAGVTATATLTVTGAGSSPAYNYSVWIPLPTTYVNLTTVVSGTGGIGRTVISGSTVGDSFIRVEFAYIDVSAVATVTFALRLTDLVFPGQAIVLPANVSYYSSPTNGLLTNGTASATINVVKAALPAPVIVSRELAVNPTLRNIGLGELVTLNVTVTFIKGTSKNAQLVIRLPTNTTADYARFTSANLIDLGALTLNQTATVNFVTSAGDAGTEIVRVFFGTVSCPIGYSGNAIVQVQLFVRDVAAAVQAYAPALALTATTRENSTLALQTTTSNPTPITLVLPAPTITIAAIASGDAGDSYNVVATVRNTGASVATAYNGALLYNLPNGISFNGAPTLAPASMGVISVVGNSVSVSINPLNSTTTVVLTIPCLRGEQVVAGANVTETVSFTARTRPSAITDLSNPSFQGRLISASGSTQHQIWSGAWTTSYTTSLDSTTATSVAIGETITILVSAQIPEGQSSARYVFALPNVSPSPIELLSATVLSKGSDLGAQGLDVGATVAATSPTSLTVDFGSLTLAGNNVLADNVTFSVLLRVANVSTAIRGASSTLSIASIVSTVQRTVSYTFTVVEPLLAATRSAPSLVLGVFGDQTTGTLDVAHAAASDSSAFNLEIRTSLPSGLVAVSASASALTGTFPSPAVASIVGGNILVQLAELPRSASIRITYAFNYTLSVVASSQFADSFLIGYTSAPSGLFRNASLVGPAATFSVRAPTITFAVGRTSNVDTLQTASSFDAALREEIEVLTNLTLIPGTQPVRLNVSTIGGNFVPILATVTSIGSGIIPSTLLLSVRSNATTVLDPASASFNFGSAVQALNASLLTVRCVFRLAFDKQRNAPGTALQIRANFSWDLASSLRSVSGVMIYQPHICAEGCDPDRGKCITFPDASEFCSCNSGRENDDCLPQINEPPLSLNCPFNTLNDTETEYIPTSVTADFTDDTLALTVLSPLVTNRRWTIIGVDSRGVRNWNCTYPGVNWQHQFDGCNDKYVSALPWASTWQPCGWQFENNPTGDYVYRANMTIEHHDFTQPWLPRSAVEQERIQTSVFALQISFQRSISLVASLVVQAPITVLAAIPLQNTSATDRLATIRVRANVLHPYNLLNASLISSPRFPSGIVSIRDVTDPAACPNQAAVTCTQEFELTVRVGSNCSFTGSYLLGFNLGCQRDAAGNLPATCAINPGDKATIGVNLISENMCGVVSRSVGLVGQIRSSADAAGLVPKTQFLPQQTVYYNASVSSTDATVTSATLSSVRLVAAGRQDVVVYQAGVSPIPSAAFAVLDSRPSNVAFNFRFSPEIVQTMSQDEQRLYTVVARIDVTYTGVGGTQKRLVLDAKLDSQSYSLATELGLSLNERLAQTTPQRSLDSAASLTTSSVGLALLWLLLSLLLL